MPANVQSMAYYGNKPWHGLGTPVRKGIAAAEMILAAGLDWEVELRRARGAREINNKPEYSRYDVIRLPRPGKEEEEIQLGFVTRRYQPLQNVDAFSFFDEIVTEGKAYFETAGALSQGERIWVMAKMPGAMQIVPGDECLKYLLLSNTHSGEGSVIAKFTAVRVVCQNTLMMAMKDGQKAYRVRHSKKMQFKLDELSQFLAITQQVFLDGEESFRRLAKIPMVADRLDSYFAAVYPRTPAQKKENERPERWDILQEIFEGRPDLRLKGVFGTLWGAYNAITCFEDYKVPQQAEQEDQWMQRKLFGGGADFKLKAFEKAKELSASWN
jgi:phage/plasmid-like protein (TIGR03299 family)